MRRSHHAKCAMTVAEYYAAHAHDGRAYIDGAPEQQPSAWISRALGSQSGSVRYCICHSWVIGILIVPGEQLLTEVPWKKAPLAGRPMKEPQTTTRHPLAAARNAFLDL